MRTTINTRLIEHVVTQFRSRFGQEPAAIIRAPGRINLLGEHVDYNDGFVMPAAIDRSVYVACSPSTTHDSTLLALDFEQQAVFDDASRKSRQQSDGRNLPDWAAYPAGVAETLVKHGLSLNPINAVFTSDIPMGSGLSSSAALEVAFLNAWMVLAGDSLPQMEQARLCQEAENQYVGVNCGIMDQFASVCGVAGRLLILDCRSLEWDSHLMPPHINIVIADTKVRRKLVSGEYNQRRQDCEEAVRLLKAKLPGIRSLRDVHPSVFDQYASLLSVRIEKRTRHVVEEIARTILARDNLAQGNILEFGQLMEACHRSLRDLFEVSCPELDVMVEIAQSLEGCLGARLTGAGFGGCTVNLVESGKVDAFTARLASEYTRRTGKNPEIYVTQPSQGVESVTT